MKWLYGSALVLLLSLTACGGGGGSPSTPAPVTPPVTTPPVTTPPVVTPAPTGKPRMAIVDYRFDQPNDITAQGNMVTSYNAVKPLIDNAKNLGFNGINLQLEVPINLNTAQVSLNDNGYTRSPPADLWKVIDYIHSQGMYVCMLVRITDSVNDIDIYSFTTVGSGFSVSTMLNNVAVYDQSLASQAEQHKVEYFSIGAGNMGIDAGYNAAWQNIVNSVKSVYTGKVMYSGYNADTPPVVYSMVDVIGVMNLDVLSKTPVNDIVSIMALYKNTASNHNLISYLTTVKSTFNKPVWFDHYSSTAADLGVNNPINLYGQGISGEIANGTLVINAPGQQLQIDAFFETVNGPLATVLDGLTIGEISPWLLSTAIQSATPASGGNYALKLLSDYQFTTDALAQSAVKTYLTQPWGYHTIN